MVSDWDSNRNKHEERKRNAMHARKKAKEKKGIKLLTIVQKELSSLLRL